MRVAIIVCGLGLSVHLVVGQNSIGIGGLPIVFDASVGGPVNAVKSVSISGGPGGSQGVVKFKYIGVTNGNAARPTPPNFVVVLPSSGTTSGTIFPATILIGLNQAVVRNMSPGDYFLNVNFSTMDQNPVSQTSTLVVLRLSRPPAPTIASVVNTATYQPAISPGGLVSIFGANFGPPVGATQYDDTGSYPKALPDGDAPFGNTTVTFNGIPAPLLYLSLGQINAVVPYGVVGQKTANVIVTCYTRSTSAFTAPILDTSPGIFTVGQNGTGQGAILNVPPINPNDLTAYTYNNVDHPAPKGSVITMFATGIGAWDPPVPDGAISLISTNPRCTDSGNPQCRKVAAPVSLTIGGKPSTILYAGSAPYEPWAVLQVNARLAIDVDSGQQPVVLTIGQNDNSLQKVTVAVQ